MKNNNFKLIKLFFVGVLASIALSCTDESTFPLPLSELQGEGDRTGAFLRVLEYTNPVVDLFDLDNADQMVFAFDFEAVDGQGGDLADKVELFVRYVDNTIPEDEDGNPIESADITTDYVSIGSVSRDAFSGASEDGYPTGSIQTNIREAITALGINDEDMSGTDSFDFAWELHLKDGRVIDRTNIGLNVSGPYFNSPFFRRYTVICVPTAEIFTGTYQLTMTQTGPFGPAFSDQEVEVIAPDYDASPATRSFEAIYLESLGIGNGPEEFQFDVVCESTVWADDQRTGLGCSGSILLSTNPDFGTATIDGSEIILNVLEFGGGGDCGAEDVPIQIVLTRID